MAVVIAPPEERMVFIVGRGRSGTTLLKTLIDTHPGISVAPEGLFVMNLLRPSRGRTWNEQNVRRFGREVFLEERTLRWSVSRDELERRWLALPAEASFARHCAEVYEAHAEATGKDPGRLLGDKNPHYSLFVDELMTTFPKARFIHIVRDYRDNVVSYQNVPFDLDGAAALAYRWEHYNRVVLDAAEREPLKFHLLRFEDLITEPVRTLDRLGEFLGLSWDASTLVHTRKKQESLPAWHRNVNEPIDPKLAGRWQNTLSESDVAMLDRICQPLGERLGYPAASKIRGSAAPMGVAYGWTITALEKLLFRFPLIPRILIIKAYRRLTGNVIE
jgi:hypothetical protein